MAAGRLMEKDIYFEVYSNRGTHTVDLEKAVSILVDIVMSANPDLNQAEVVHKAGARVRNGLVHQVEDYNLLFNDEDVPGL